MKTKPNLTSKSGSLPIPQNKTENDMVENNEVEVVNIAASGDINAEVDIEQLANDCDLAVSNYDPEFNAASFRFEEDGELVLLYRTGKYILRGGDDFDKMRDVNQKFLQFLSSKGINVSDPIFEVKNVVCVGDMQQSVDFNQLIAFLGLENTEYEPEQFPGVVYRPTYSRCVLLIFASGKVVITGGRSKEDDESAFFALLDELNLESKHK